MTDTQAIIMAVIAVLSLSVQGLVKALDIVGKRKAAKSLRPPADNTGAFPALAAKASFDHHAIEAKIEKLEAKVDHSLKLIRELHQWHNVHDPATGVKSWIISPEWLKTIKLIELHMADQTRLLKAISDNGGTNRRQGE